jgi:hypothetical protein
MHSIMVWKNTICIGLYCWLQSVVGYALRTLSIAMNGYENYTR